jgi:hypothetical protein
MKIVGREKLMFAGFNPFLLIQTLALRTVAITARVIGYPHFIARIAFVDMTTQLRCAADLYGIHDTIVTSLHSMLERFPKRLTVGTKNMGYFKLFFHERPSLLRLRLLIIIQKVYRAF